MKNTFLTWPIVYYYCSFCLFVLWICLEIPFIDSFWPWGFLSTPCLLILNCLLMFALNLQACLVISHTSALRFAQTKAVRDLVVVLLLPSLLADRRLTPTSNIGYSIGEISISSCSIILHFFSRDRRAKKEHPSWYVKHLDFSAVILGTWHLWFLLIII